MFLHDGLLILSHTNFTENMAAAEGLAIAAYGSLDLYGDKNFDGSAIRFSNNSFFCPLGEYSYDRDPPGVRNRMRAASACM